MSSSPTTAATELENEYIDYELFTSPDFSPIAFCNSLVLGINNSSDDQIDLDPAITRVKFDLEEVEKLLHLEVKIIEHFFIK